MKNAELNSFLTCLNDPISVQSHCLTNRILLPNVDCEYGRRYGFARIRSVEDYRKAVPIRDYEAIRGDVERMASGEQKVLVAAPVRRFFLTSGSSGDPKHIPVTSGFLRDKSWAFRVFWASLLEAHTEAKNKKMLMNFPASDEHLSTSGGLPCGSESSFWGSWTAGLRSDLSALPTAVRNVSEVESRYYTIARYLLEEDLSIVMALQPSTLLLLFEKLNGHAETLIEDIHCGGLTDRFDIPDQVRDDARQRFPAKPVRARELEAFLKPGPIRWLATELWPDLKVVACWRSPMLSWYLRRLEAYIGPGPEQRDYVSMASEGILAIPVRDCLYGGVPAVPIHFYEFIPIEEAEGPCPATRLIHQLELNREYVVVLSTTAGLYRYNIGDVVRVAGFLGRTPVVGFLHRFGATCSLTGEKLTEPQIVAAVHDSAERLALQLAQFVAFPSLEPFPHYVFLVHFKDVPEPLLLRRFLEAIDRELQVLNIEYAAKRGSLRLANPTLMVTGPGGFETAKPRETSARPAEEQIKPRHLSRNPDFHKGFDIRETIDAYR